MADEDKLLEEFRPLLFSIAYRMTGSVMDSEDILQEAYFRLRKTDLSQVENPRAYLSSIVTRLCIDFLRSAKVKREEYIGPWLPEPLISSGKDGGEQAAILAESLSTGFLILLESLSPIERAVYLLRTAFEYDYAEIAAIVEKTESNCRKIFSRAQNYIRQRRPRFTPQDAKAHQMTGEFLRVVSEGDMDGFLSILADDVVVYSDGGGKAFAARKPVIGAGKVAQFFMKIATQGPENVVFRQASVNGLPGLVFFVDQAAILVMAFEIFENKIQRVFSILNPDKLKNVAFVAHDQSDRS